MARKIESTAQSNSLILIIFFCLSVLLLLFSKNGVAQSQTQDERIHTMVEKFFDLYNSGDTASYRKFLEPVSETESELQRTLTGYNNAFRMIGKVDVKRIQVNSPQQAEVWTKDLKYDAWWKFSIYADSLQHFKRRTIQPSPFESHFIQTGRLSNQQISEAIDEYLNNKLSSNFSGNVFIANGNQVIYSKSFGTNPENQPNTFEQQFHLASTGKMFTAISILQLKDKGLLSLVDSVKKFLPALENTALANITISQLLTHTSGMGDFFEHPLYEKLKDSLRTAKDFLPFIDTDKPSFEPGKGWRYSNTGFCLLALIIEKVSNKSFEDYIVQNIFAKASMSKSVTGSGAGGGLSTISDLNHFSKALIYNKLLNKTTTTELLEFTVNGKYGYGTEHQTLGEENIVGHSGGFINVCNELNIYTKSNYIVIILSNSNPPYAHFLSNKIKELLVRK
ncbi:MAG TPA: serine hydrolase domain-containing protein [Chitinophagaceae bacterium]|nr:serine hydrolase domain-containing protein [Chitinophagaceae bacterium]